MHTRWTSDKPVVLQVLSMGASLPVGGDTPKALLSIILSSTFASASKMKSPLVVFWLACWKIDAIGWLNIGAAGVLDDGGNPNPKDGIDSDASTGCTVATSLDPKIVCSYSTNC